MYRRRDTGTGRSAYSSADAYRSLNSPPSSNSHSNSHSGNPDSSEDEAQLQRNSGTPIAERFARRKSSDQAIRESALSPPRPFFLGDARSSYSASSETASGNEASDSDVPAPPAKPQPVAPAARPSPRSTSRSRAGSVPTPTPVQPPNANPRVRQRNHRRRSSMANEYSPDADGEDVTSVASGAITPNSPPVNPFDTPTNSFYGSMPPGAAPPAVGGARPPPSSFPFQSHPGNPDPGTPIPGMGRRSSIESIRAREAALGAHRTPSTPNFPGTVYPMGSGAAGYGLISHGGDMEGDLGRPYAPFMEHDVPSREGSATPPSPMSSQNRLYMNSAAAAMSGSNHALNQGMCGSSFLPEALITVRQRAITDYLVLLGLEVLISPARSPVLPSTCVLRSSHLRRARPPRYGRPRRTHTRTRLRRRTRR